ncbi:sugar ABC transporter substrate-binding protein [Halobacillus aidingensis]|uniref:Multiple sugar transport system substrate-binding protein n=1 Tax=Halobacillus aidingensis TaxID=240303 RepID=A0A1H0LZP9_HALAD|nr:sugar ABC transporter substrate-binding protein [Halobacillus aidingensis]SDO73436.1 multiple sugar transport system substrate-binding protein [Halobacillus aidingensis]
MKGKLWLLIAVVLTSLTLTGCSDSSSSGGDEHTVTVWAMGEEGKKLKEFSKDFEEKNEGLTVDVQAIPWDTAHDKLLTAVASGNGPDVVQLGTTWVPEFAEAGALLDLSEHMEDYPNFAKENYFDGSVTTMEHEDQVVGIPWYADTRVIYYRKDVLKEAGYEEAPKTWDELKDAAKKLADRGEGSYGLDIDRNDQITPFIFAWQNGYEANLEEGDLNFDSPEFKEAIQYYTSYFEEGISQKQEGKDIVEAFKDGSKPMFFSGPWMINIINDQAPDLEGKWATAVMPTKETNTSSMGGANLSIFESSDNVEGALEFISYMTDVETQLSWLEESNTLPPRTEAWEDPVMQENPMYATFGEQLENTKPGLQTEQFERIAQELLAHIERITVGGADVEKELEEFNQEAQSLIEE